MRAGLLAEEGQVHRVRADEGDGGGQRAGAELLEEPSDLVPPGVVQRSDDGPHHVGDLETPRPGVAQRPCKLHIEPWELLAGTQAHEDGDRLRRIVHGAV